MPTDAPTEESATRWPLTSVVVSTKNRVSLLEDCLSSLLTQDYPTDRFEIVVVDDGSTDGTLTYVRSLSDRSEPRVRYVTSNGGHGAARNAGLGAAGGDPICFVDDDVRVPPSWLRAMIDGSIRHSNALCLGGPVRPVFEVKPPRTCGRERFPNTELDHGSADTEVQLVWGCNMAIPRSAFDVVGPFREDLRYEVEKDWERRLIRSGGRVMYVADAWLWHRRLATDVRARYALRQQFRRGFITARRHERRNVRRAAINLVRSLAHGGRHWCAWGPANASRQAGMIGGYLLRRSKSRSRAATLSRTRTP